MYKTSPLWGDEIYLKVQFRTIMGYPLNLKTPKTFQEKLQWLKINDRKPVYHRMVDKFESKKLISEKVGAEYTIPTLAIWDSFKDIDIKQLPNAFFLKCTHDSGSYYYCTNKERFNINEVKKKLNASRTGSYYYSQREWPYKGVKRRIMAEPVLASPNELKEYKFFCFNGEPKFYQTCEDRNPETHVSVTNVFNTRGELMEFQEAGQRYTNLSINQLPQPPVNLEKMIEFAKLFSKDTYFLRVDFFEVNGKMYMGEFTFYEDGGYFSLEPEEYNRIVGDWIKLPCDNEH